MQFVEGGKLYFHAPRVLKKIYVWFREHNRFLIEQYNKLKHNYGIIEPKHLSLQTPVLFQEEPMVYIQDVYEQLGIEAEPQSLICCYESYPFTDRRYPAIYIKKALGFMNTQAFALTDQGAASPVSAIEWAYATQSETLVVCIEQLYDVYQCRDPGFFNRAEALGIFYVGVEKSDFQILCFGNRFVRNGTNSVIDSLTDAVVKVIHDLADSLGLGAADILVITPSINKGFEMKVRALLPSVYFREDCNNLSTAGPLYSLDSLFHYHKAWASKYLYFCLLFLDHSGNLGFVLAQSTDLN